MQTYPLPNHKYPRSQGTGTVDMSPGIFVQSCDVEQCLSICPEMPPVNPADLLHINQEWCDGCQHKKVHPPGNDTGNDTGSGNDTGNDTGSGNNTGNNTGRATAPKRSYFSAIGFTPKYWLCPPAPHLTQHCHFWPADLVRPRYRRARFQHRIAWTMPSSYWPQTFVFFRHRLHT